MKPKQKRPPWRPKIWTDEAISEEAYALEEWYQRKDTFYLKDFCIERGYSAQKMSEFANVSEHFSEALRISKMVQESRLVKGGLLNKFNASIVSLTLKNVSGFRDRFDDSKDDNHEALVKISEFIDDIRKGKD